MEKYFIYGIHAVIGALQNPKRKVYMVYVNSKVYMRYKSIISKHKYKIMENFSVFKVNRHQNLIAEVDRLPYQQMNIIGKEEVETVLILDNIMDTFNIGSIIRTAVNLGVKNVIVNKRGPGESAAVVKAAAGMFEGINFIPVVNIVSTVKLLKQKEFWVIGLTAHSQNSIDSVTRMGKRIAIIIGSEDKGMRSLVYKNLDLSVKIPILGESLNASNAAAIALFAFRNK